MAEEQMMQFMLQWQFELQDRLQQHDTADAEKALQPLLDVRTQLPHPSFLMHACMPAPLLHGECVYTNLDVHIYSSPVAKTMRTHAYRRTCV